MTETTRDERQGPISSSGRGSVRTDPRSAADDLIRVLEQRRDDAQAELQRLDAGDSAAAHDRDVLRARVTALETDVAALRTGPGRQDLDQIAAIARRNDIDPAHVRGDLQATGNTDVETRGAAANGLGVSRTRIVDNTQVRGGDRAGATQGSVRTETASTALTENGLEQQTNVTNVRTTNTGASYTGSRGSSARVGSAQGGLGIQGSRTESDSVRNADRSGRTVASDTSGGVGLTRTGITAGGQRVGTNTEHRADGSSTEDRTTTGGTGRLSVDGQGRVTGGSIGGSREQRTTNNDANGEATDRQTRSTSGSVGFVRGGDQGTGLTLSGSHSRSDTHRDGGGGSRATNMTPGSSASATGSGDLTVTDRQVGGNGSGTGSIGRGPVRASLTIGGGASYTITADPIPDSNPPRYRLQTVLRYSVSGGVTLGNNSDRMRAPAATPSMESQDYRARPATSGTASVGISASEQRTRTFSQEMSLDELRAYMSEADRARTSGQSPGAAPPEIGMIARIRAAAAMRRVPSEAELETSQAALGLRNGQRVNNESESTRTSNASASGTVGAVTVGGSASRTVTSYGSREIQRTPDRDGTLLVVVRMTFRSTTDTTVSGNAAVSGVGGRAQQQVVDQSGRTIEVRLRPPPGNPNYDREYREALAVQNQAQAEALAQRTNAALTRTAQRTTTNSGGVGTMDRGNVSSGLTQSEQRSTASQVTVSARDDQGRRTVSGNTTGSSQSQMGANIAGTTVLQQTEQTTATNTVDAQGRQTVNVTNTQSGGLQIPAWLQARWRTVRQRIESWDLDEHDLSELASRARNRHGWLNALHGVELLHIRDAWMAFGSAVANPQPAADLREANEEMALKITRGEAVTSFIGGVGPGHGMAAMGAILREQNPAHPLGVHWEWPDALRSQQTEWNTLHGEVRGIAGRFAGMAGADRSARIGAERTRIAGRLNAIKQAIDGCTTFGNASAKPEMLDAIDRDLRTLERAAREALATPPAQANTAPATNATTPSATPNANPTAQSGGQATQAQGQTVATTPPPSPQADLERRRAEAADELVGLRTTLQRYKGTELEHWRGAQWRIGRADGVFANTNEEVNGAIAHLDQIEVDWVGRWGASWHRALELHRTLGTERDAPRALKTNWHWRGELLRQAIAKVGPTARFAFDPAPRLSRWEQQDRDP